MTGWGLDSSYSDSDLQSLGFLSADTGCRTHCLLVRFAQSLPQWAKSSVPWSCSVSASLLSRHPYFILCLAATG